MKFIVALCAVLTVSAVHADEVTTTKQGLPSPTDVLWQIVNVEKKVVELIQDELVKFQKESSQKLDTKLNDIRTSGMIEVEKLVKSSLETVQKDVIKARHEGKNADVCYEKAKNLVNEISDNSNAAFGTCRSIALETTEAPLKKVDDAIETASQLIADLNEIVPKCHSSLFIKMQNCVLRKTALAGPSVASLQVTTKAAKWGASSSIANAQASSKSCTAKVVSDAKTSTTEVEISSSRCIRDIPTA